MNTQITIDGIKYDVLGATRFDFYGDDRFVVRLRRPRGRRIYQATVYGNGAISGVV